MKKIITLIGILIFTSTSTFAQTVEKEKEKIIELILNSDSIKRYIHPEIENRTPVVILKNKNIPKSFIITVIDTSVVIMNKNEIIENGIEAYFEFFETNISTEIAIIKFIYNIEGINCSATVKKTNSKWAISRFQLYEQ